MYKCINSEKIYNKCKLWRLRNINKTKVNIPYRYTSYYELSL